MLRHSVWLCLALAALTALCEARRGRGPRGGRWKRHAACEQTELVGGVNTTVYDHPCAFSLEEGDPEDAPSLLECGLRRRRGCGRTENVTTSYCMPRECDSDQECLGVSTCRRGQCTVAHDYLKFAGACRVLSASGEVVRTKPCIRDQDECGTDNLVETISIDILNNAGNNQIYTAYFCRRPDDHTTTTSRPFPVVGSGLQPINGTGWHSAL